MAVQDVVRQLVPEARRYTRWALLHGLVQAGSARGVRSGDLHSLFMTDPQHRVDPCAFYDQVRAQGTVVPGRFAAVTASHAVCAELLRSSDFRSGPDEDAMPWPLRRLIRWSRDPAALGATDPPSMLVAEPPDHTRYRRLVSRVFTPRAVVGLRGRIQQIADDLLDRMAGPGPVDLVDAYATRLPVAVICEVLGVPAKDHDRLLRFGHAAAPALDVGIDYGRYRGVDQAIREFQLWIADHLDHLRREPGPDLLSQLVHLEDDGQRLTEDELRVTALLLLAAGFETTVNLLGSGAALLLGHPGQRARLQADPSLWTGAVEEVLRLEAPVQLTGRFALRDTQLGGHRLTRGALVLAYLGGANRDPAVFDDPQAFDAGRANAREHLSFSAGRHFCIGASLARLEGEVGLRSLFERYPDLALTGPGRRTETVVLRGWEHLPARTAP